MVSVLFKKFQHIIEIISLYFSKKMNIHQSRIREQLSVATGDMSVCLSLSISLWSLLTSHYEKLNTQKTPASVMDPVFTDFLPRCVLSLSLSLSRLLFVLILPPAVEKVRLGE